MIDIQTFLHPKNRGKLFDVLIFIFNILAIAISSRLALNLFREASDGDKLAQLAIGLICFGVFLLMPIGAVLKRWNYQERKPKEKKQKKKKKEEDDDEFKSGVSSFFLIMFWAVMFFIGIGAFLLLDTVAFGDRDVDKTYIFIAVIVLLILSILQTGFVLSYFRPYENEPTLAFLKTPQSEWFGDILLFLNMIIFQTVWAMILGAKTGLVSGFTELIARAIVFFLIALFFYFPPRIFYLLEDITDKKTWLTMLLANSPTIFRFLFGI